MRPGESGTVHSRLPGPGGSGYPVDRLVDRPSRPGCAGERKFPSGGSVPRIFCRLANQDPNGSHPLTRSLQAIPIQRTPAGVCRLDEPGNYFPPALRTKKFTPATPGHAEEISLKINSRNPRSGLMAGAALIGDLCDSSQRSLLCRSRAACVYSNPCRQCPYQKGSDGYV